MNNLEKKFEKSSNFISKYSYDQLIHWGVDVKWAEYVNLFVLFSLTLVLIYVVYYIVLHIFRFLLTWFSKKGKRPFLKALYQHRFAHFLALIAPVSLINAAIPVVFDDFRFFKKPLNMLLGIYVVFMIIWIVRSILKALAENLKSNTKIGTRPLESYLQVITIILYLFGAIVIFSDLTGKSPLAFFGVLGAASAVLLLMFKDTIMGFVASIQVTTNDMVRIGDWIAMPEYNADGDVLAISLTTVKVQNWDKTITTIPTHALISSSFINWRGMSEYGGRRIKRSILIKQSSIRFLREDELSKFEQIQGIKEYIKKRQSEINAFNKRFQFDRSLPLNGRNLTNSGLFRKYALTYLQNHPGISKDKTIMVRQLDPTEHGIPLELYTFCNQITWVEYEAIMSDIFDHLIAAVPYFELEIYEGFSGNDFVNNREIKLKSTELTEQKDEELEK